MQLNPPHKTIEGELFDAFVKAGAVSKDNADDPKKSSLIRAARTDKGVHAGGNVVSLKLIVEDSDIVEKINSHLPDQIRMWGYSRTNKAFECRKMCTSRVYEYMIPSYVFLPPKPTSHLAEMLRSAKQEVRSIAEEESPSLKEEGEKFWESVSNQLTEAGISTESINKSYELEQEQLLSGGLDSAGKQKEVKEEDATTNGSETYNNVLKRIKEVENRSRRAYRISSERLELARKVFKVYEGHHNFHNFTIGKAFKDPSSQRYMKTLDISDPKIINGTEWLSIKIHGQSFMLHQIRKMVAMAVLIVRTGCPISRISEAFEQNKINIPKAPSLGLLLEHPVYDSYNQRLGNFGYEPISFDKYAEEIDAFKMKYIYDKIYSEEAKENVFTGFFNFIDCFRGEPIFEYLTVKGITAKASEAKDIKIGNDDEDELEGDIEG
ncbi:pseudouridine synthase PUS1 [Sugiyamaella lignohabitans]|uniref:tRNA pseudouridine synthase 1 n=1 Tax=Sugiyamaella lignohabitans TaxID=796027 RepID=A0A167DBI4_9ASCO|nr:pseudouridine synthase PUS1 [Sugiyamaella lignohabitans]ANB12716.1 pseudouridine synthase PUS1 [Sugiyamaella lignohabitans]